MRILLNGALGRMGAEVINSVNKENSGCTLAGGVDKFSKTADIPASLDEFKGEADVIIDFSHFSMTKDVTEYAVKHNLPVVIATTGQGEEEMACIKAASEKIPVFYSANMSLGVALLVELAKTTAKAFPDADIEIVEAHHNRKVDAPSGTALMIADGIKEVRTDAVYNLGRSGVGKREKNEIGIAAVRMGNIVGDHQVFVSTDTQTITLRHQAYSRALFADGAISAAKFLQGKPAGLYNMKSIVSEN
jgi:4-hydroxy-tetrahydrodipicolinate reductase